MLARPASVVVTVVVIALAPATRAAGPAGESTGGSAPFDIRMSPISGPADEPRRHFRLRQAARLASAEAAAYYEIIRGALQKGYGRSGLPVTAQYQQWRRYNTAPYRSATHGNHYLNNYANSVARSYGRPGDAGEFPVGSVIAKDSFAVTRTGGILLGPLFIMEKMPSGFRHASGDWRYTLVQPDGTVLGRTNGRGSGRVEYCIACHLSAEHEDHVFFVPPEFRREQVPPPSD